jgi:hypothetical protein
MPSCASIHQTNPNLLICCRLQFSIEVAAIASPYAAILDVFDHRIKYLRNGEDVVSLKP